MKHPPSEPTKRFPTFSVDDAISEKDPLAIDSNNTEPQKKISQKPNTLDKETGFSIFETPQDVINSVKRLCESGLKVGDTHTTFGSFALMPNQLGIRVAAISEITRIVVETLQARAQLTPEDFKALKDVAERACEALEIAGEQVPDHELKVAPPSKTWPINLARRQLVQKSARRTLQLFTRSPHPHDFLPSVTRDYYPA